MKVKKLKDANLPGAWIVDPENKGRKSIKLDKIYLNDNKEFEIEIFNPLRESVLADIRLNGNSISKTGLVVSPGQRIYINSFIDDGRKFIFKTYDVENSEEANNAIENNGMLEVFFYKEETISLINWRNIYRNQIIQYYPTTWLINQHYYTSPFNTVITTSPDNYYNTYSNITNTYSNTNAIYSNTIETGRVEKGEKSDQHYVNVDMNFENNYITHIVYQLLPYSRKPKEIKDILNKKEISKQQTDATDLLIKLKLLWENGILTGEEFQQKKKEILTRI